MDIDEFITAFKKSYKIPSYVMARIIDTSKILYPDFDAYIDEFNALAPKYKRDPHKTFVDIIKKNCTDPSHWTILVSKYIECYKCDPCDDEVCVKKKKPKCCKYYPNCNCDCDCKYECDDYSCKRKNKKCCNYFPHCECYGFQKHRYYFDYFNENNNTVFLMLVFLILFCIAIFVIIKMNGRK